jgi:hypothetical protein
MQKVEIPKEIIPVLSFKVDSLSDQGLLTLTFSEPIKDQEFNDTIDL